MRSVIAITSAVSMMLAQVPSAAFAQTSPPAAQPVTWSAPQTEPQKTEAQNPVLAKTFKTFPNGGDGLVKRISDLIAANPKLATDLLNYVQTTPGVTYGQKIAAERGLAAALERLGIKAADLPMPTKAPPMVAEVPPAYDYTWLAALAAAAAVVGVVCLTSFCRTDHHVVQISPN